MTHKMDANGFDICTVRLNKGVEYNNNKLSLSLLIIGRIHNSSNVRDTSNIRLLVSRFWCKIVDNLIISIAH